MELTSAGICFFSSQKDNIKKTLCLKIRFGKYKETTILYSTDELRSDARNICNELTYSVYVCNFCWCQLVQSLRCFRWRQHMSGRVDKCTCLKKKRRSAGANLPGSNNNAFHTRLSNRSPTESRVPSVWCPSLRPPCTSMLSEQLARFRPISQNGIPPQ